MSLKRLALALVLFLSFALEAAIPPEGNPHCPPAPEGGSLACRTRCRSFALGSYCESNVEPPPPETSYCYQVRYDPFSPVMSCHEGDYDQCCDKKARF
jgi:hypothetical protein